MAFKSICCWKCISLKVVYWVLFYCTVWPQILKEISWQINSVIQCIASQTLELSKNCRFNTIWLLSSLWWWDHKYYTAKKREGHYLVQSEDLLLAGVGGQWTSQGEEFGQVGPLGRPLLWPLLSSHSSPLCLQTRQRVRIILWPLIFLLCSLLASSAETECLMSFRWTELLKNKKFVGRVLAW